MRYHGVVGDAAFYAAMRCRTFKSRIDIVATRQQLADLTIGQIVCPSCGYECKRTIDEHQQLDEKTAVLRIAVLAWVDGDWKPRAVAAWRAHARRFGGSSARVTT